MLPLNQVLVGNCVEVMKGFPKESIDMVMFSPPYWGLRDYGDETVTVWSAQLACEHEWAEEKMTLVHENRNFQRGTQEEVVGKKGTTFIKKHDDKVARFCVKCGAWRGQLGLEPTYQMYVEHLVEVCRAVKRVLKNIGSMYIVLGDTYAGSWCGRGDKRPKQNFRRKVNHIYGKTAPQRYADIPPKCLVGIPWRVILALMDDGWILRNDIIWYKPNHMPSSVKDRLSNTYEHIFHLVKSRRYYYDLDAIRVPHSAKAIKRAIKELKKGLHSEVKDNKWIAARAVGLVKDPLQNLHGKSYADTYFGKLTKHDLAVGRVGNCGYKDPLHTKAYNIKGKNPGDTIKIPETWGVDKKGEYHGKATKDYASVKAQNPSQVKRNIIESFKKQPKGKNPGDFWSVSTKPFKGAHFAVYPPKVCVKPIKSSCPPGGIVLDPMCGSGTTLVVAKKLGRKYIGIDINPEYVDIAIERSLQVAPLDRWVGASDS